MSEMPSNMESERRLVTVMFADVSGFTAMSERMDPEEVADLMTGCFSLMEECIEQHGGTIDKFIGDSVMALFGAPRALEDAPHRAIDTALEIMGRVQQYNEDKRLTMPLGIHVGINTGPVVAGMLGGQKKQDFTVMGDTVNLASRLVNTAEDGTILVAENTYHLTQGYFEFEPMGEVQVKGKEHPVMAYRVIGHCQVKTRIEACLSKGLTPFVGRGREIAHLMECFEEVKEGRGQVVGVVGEPGVGKSRLVCEFRESLPSGACTSLEGGCLHYGDTIPYLPILDILKDYFRIHEEEKEKAIKEKIRGRIASFGDRCGAIEAPIHEVLSLPVDDPVYEQLEPRQRRERVFEAIRMLLMVESQSAPLVVVVEDLHWIDKTSEEFLTYLINALANTPIMLILLYRPEYTPGWVGKSYYSQVRVGQLTVKASEDLVKAILTEGEVVSELSRLVVERAAGNPLFIEELTHSLMENGSIEKKENRYILAHTASHIQVPATIQGIIASRLDRLEGTLKRIMQVAAVIGREFAFRILQSVASLKEDVKASLLTLQDLEFIYEKSLFPELEYIFKHALTQEVAYNSLLIKKRKELHEQVGNAIEEIYGDRLEEFSEMLAYHFSMSENTDKAYTYLKRSADKAVKNYANWEAIRLFKQCISILDGRQETPDNKMEKLAHCLSMITPLWMAGYPEGSLEILQQAKDLACQLEDDKSLAWIYSRIAHYHSMKGNISSGIEYSEHCFILAEKTHSIDLMAQSAGQVCVARWVSGDYVKVADVGCRTLSILEKHQEEKNVFSAGLNVFSTVSAWCGSALGFMGEFDQAKIILERGLQNAIEVGSDKYSMGWLNFCYTAVSYSEGNGEKLVANAKEAIRYFEETQADIALGYAWAMLGLGYFLLGEMNTARENAEKGLEIQKRLAIGTGLPWIYFVLSLISSDSGDLQKARGYALEALNLSREYRARHFELTALLELGRILGKDGPANFDDAQQHINQGISLAQELRLKPSAAVGHLYLGELYLDAEKKEKALEHLTTAASMYQEMGVDLQYYWPTRIGAALERAKKM